MCPPPPFPPALRLLTTVLGGAAHQAAAQGLRVAPGSQERCREEAGPRGVCPSDCPLGDSSPHLPLQKGWARVSDQILPQSASIPSTGWWAADHVGRLMGSTIPIWEKSLLAGLGHGWKSRRPILVLRGRKLTMSGVHWGRLQAALKRGPVRRGKVHLLILLMMSLLLDDLDEMFWTRIS